MTGIVIHLTADQKEQALDRARARDAIKHRHGNGRHGTYAGKSSTVQMHYPCALAEIAVQTALKQTHGVDIQIDDSISARGQKRGNLIAPEWRGMVKHRGQRGWDAALKSDKMDTFFGDILFLVWPDRTSPVDALEVMGWISRDEFEDRAISVSYIKGKPSLAVDIGDLHSMSRLPSPVYERVEQGALFGEAS